jgi:hypothetical protein
MKIKSTIEFTANRSVSASGNVENWQFTIVANRSLSNDTIEHLCKIHGCFGQSFSYSGTKPDGTFIYSGEATCYSN